MRLARKCVTLLTICCLAWLAVSPQAAVNVWAYRTVRAVHLLPHRKDAVALSAVTGNIEERDLENVRTMTTQALRILKAELDYEPVSSVRVVVDETLKEHGTAGYYQLGTVRVSSTGVGAEQFGAILHEMAHLAVDYLAHGNYPGWLTEGIAVYLELEYAGFSWADMNKERSWHEIEVLDGALSSANVGVQAAAYWQSYALVSYMYELGGRESVVALLGELGRGVTLVNALNRVYGLTLHELGKEALLSFRLRQEATK